MENQITYNYKTRIVLIVALSLLLVASVVTICFLPAVKPAFAATNTQTSGKFTFTDNSLTTGELLVSIANNSYVDDEHFGQTLDGYCRTYVAIKSGKTVLYSETSNWVTSKDSVTGTDDIDNFVFAKQKFTINTVALLEEGKIEANTAYTLYVEAAIYANMGMGENLALYQETDSYTANFSFTLQAVSEIPPEPTKTGYTFTGWYTDKECTKLYTEDKIIGNITLYAGFRPNNYTIKFDGNGKSSGSTSNLSMKYDTAANLTTNGFNRTGYKFKGWATSPTGSVVYTDGQSVKNLTSADGATITLYAVWEQVVYTVRFNANGGDGEMNDQSHTRDVSKKLANNLFTRTGYEFKGWATSPNGAVVYTNMQSVVNIGNAGSTVQLYAVWQVNKLTIKYNAGDGTGTIANQTVNYGESATLTPVEGKMQREYYRFVGWATTENGEVVYTDGNSISNTNPENSTITLYAIWEPVMCYVTLIVDGEVYAIIEVAAGTPTSSLYSTADISPLLYEFEGDSPN